MDHPAATSLLAKTDFGAGRLLHGKDRRLDRILSILLNKKRWRLLRYLHAREGMLLAEQPRSVLVVGAGYGLAEVALARSGGIRNST